MTSLPLFRKLKDEVLSEYGRHHPFFSGTWQSFSSNDIQNLIALIEERTRQQVSEKWIYTHLKPVQNDKLPRKDMLDILSRFAGYSGWDEFVFRHHKMPGEANPILIGKGIGLRKKWLMLISIAIGIAVAIVWWQQSRSAQSIEIKEAYTNKAIDSNEVKAYRAEGRDTIPVEIKNSAIQVGDNREVVVESPYYKRQKIRPKTSGTVYLKPDDRAMMLRAFMISDIKDWKTRKIQLDTILSDDLEVIVMLKGNLGSEYYNKEQFSQKLIIPTTTVRKMKIVEMKSTPKGKIEFIRITQQ